MSGFKGKVMLCLTMFSLVLMFALFCSGNLWWACIWGALGYVLVSIILITCSKISCKDWCLGTVDIKEFLGAEDILKKTRWICYIAATVFIILSWASEYISRICQISALELQECDPYTYFAMLMGVLLFFCLVQSLFRITFRRFPNWCIAVGVVLMYEILVVLNQECPSDLNAVKKIFNWTSNEIVIGALSGLVTASGIITIITEAISGIWRDNQPRSENRETWRVRLRKTRIQLLLHGWYKEHGILSSINNCAIIVLLRITTMITIVFFNIISKENEIINVEAFWWLLIFSATLCAFGIVTHWSCNNARLLQAEFYYICHVGPHLKAEDIKEGRALWRDYCQVFSHIYNSKIDVFSEDYTLHNLKEVVRKTAIHLKDDGVCETFFYTELLRNYNETKFKDERQCDTQERGREDTTEYPLAVYLARTLPAAFFTDRSVDCLGPDSGFCDFLYLAKNCYFQPHNVPGVWEKYQGLTRLNVEEFQNLVILDVWCDLLQSQPFIGICALEPMCNECRKCWLEKNEWEDRTGDHKAVYVAMLLLFPYMVASALKKRYGKEDTVKIKGSSFDDTMEYYKTLFYEGSGKVRKFIKEDDGVYIDKIIQAIIRFFIRKDEYGTEVAKELCKQTDIIEEYYKGLIESENIKFTYKIKRKENYNFINAYFNKYVKNNDSFYNLMCAINLSFEEHN